MTTLTNGGRKYAEAKQGESLVAKVALYGEDWGWPNAHIDTARSVCNDRAGDERLLADVLVSDAPELD